MDVPIRIVLREGVRNREWRIILSKENFFYLERIQNFWSRDTFSHYLIDEDLAENIPLYPLFRARNFDYFDCYHYYIIIKFQRRF